MKAYSRAKSVYPGWWVLVSTTLLGMFAGGVLYHGASVFFNPIRRDLNLSAASTSLIFTISRAQAGVVGPLFGWIVDKVGARPLIITGSLLAGVGLIILHRINSFLPFLLVYILIVSVGTNMGFGQTLLTTVNRWFVRRKAIAMTILLTGFAAGGAIFVFPLGLGVDTIGWRSTLLYSGVAVIVIGLFLSLFIHHSPERLGILPEGLEESSREDSDSDSSETKNAVPADFSLNETFKSKMFWIILTASTLRISAETGLMIHIIPIMAWKGMDESAAAGLVSVFFFLSIPFRVLLGTSGQKLPVQPLLVVGMLSAVSGIVLVVVSDGTWSLYPFVVLLAIYEGSVVLQWLAVGDFFGRRSYGTLTGIMRAFDTLGSLAMPIYAGWIFDTTGSYSPALITFAAMLGATGLLYAIMRKPVPPSHR